MSDRLNTTAKKRQSSDSAFNVNPFQPRGFAVQARAEESTPATKAQLWESYQQTKQLNQSGAIQAKLTIGQPGDKYEQEADSNAQQVMAMPASGLATSIVTNSLQTPSIEPIQRVCTDCQEEPKEESKSEEDGDRIQAKEGLGQTPELTSVRRKLDSADDPQSGSNSDSQFDGSQEKSILAITDRPPTEIQRAPDKMPPKKGTTTINKKNEQISASGNTLTEAITNLTSQGKGEAGRVTCAPEWNKQAWQADENKPAAIVVTANVTVTETKAMPVWTELDRQCEPVKKEWARFYQALDTHEEGHIKIDETSFKDLHKKLLGKTPAIADEIYNTTVTQANTNNDAYDATTQHGLTQGTAVTPVQCQAMEKVSQNQDDSSTEFQGQESDASTTEIQAKADAPVIQTSNKTLSVQPDLESRLGSSKGGGSPLSNDVRSFMEPRFGADFSGVRVHTGTDAVQMNLDVNAQAFARGQDIYFGAGKLPGNNELTAHELTHVVQQTSGMAVRGKDNTIQKFPSWEKAASELACAVLNDEEIYGLFVNFYFSSQPNAKKHLEHYVKGGGKDYPENVEDLFGANPRIRSRIAELINEQITDDPTMTGGEIVGKGVDDGQAAPIAQSDYDSEDWRNANGNIDRVEWQSIGKYDPTRSNKFQVTITDPYTWHPLEKRPTQCLHEAFERLKSKSAADYITKGTAGIILPPASQSPDVPLEADN